MSNNNYEKRIKILNQLKDMGSEIDSLAQSTMIKEIVFMFAHNGQFKECEQVIKFFKGKIQADDLKEMLEIVHSQYGHQLNIEK